MHEKRSNLVIENPNIPVTPAQAGIQFVSKVPLPLAPIEPAPYPAASGSSLPNSGSILTSAAIAKAGIVAMQTQMKKC